MCKRYQSGLTPAFSGGALTITGARRRNMTDAPERAARRRVHPPLQRAVRQRTERDCDPSFAHSPWPFGAPAPSCNI